MIASAQLEALDSTTPERGHEPDVSVVPGGELTVSAPSLSGVRWRPWLHLGNLPLSPFDVPLVRTLTTSHRRMRVGNAEPSGGCPDSGDPAVHEAASFDLAGAA